MGLRARLCSDHGCRPIVERTGGATALVDRTDGYVKSWAWGRDLTLQLFVDFHPSLGSPVKQARVQYLRDCWVKDVSDVDNIEILTPDFPSMYGAIMSFRVTGRTSKADNKAISEYLFDRYGIFTVERDGPVNGSCVRVIPAVFTLRE